MRKSDASVVQTHGQFDASTVLVCFSHLRWDFVYQRPQHIMSRLARGMAVHFWEEPVVGSEANTFLDTRICPQTGVHIIRPTLAAGSDPAQCTTVLAQLLSSYVAGLNAKRVVKWYYTPMMLPFSESLAATCTVYDCMDELANFRFAPPELIELERRLFGLADIVFTGGYSLYEAKRSQHPNIHPFPSSVDREHFAQARNIPGDHPAYADIPHPRLGYYGVIDERMDFELLERMADAHPDWQLVMVGPLAKVGEGDLPRRANIHWLGRSSYEDLPRHLACWDVALMPFAINESTRFISPTKTPEYLAGGRPVVSTPITDVVRHYGDLDGVFIAERDMFVLAAEKALACAENHDWRSAADSALQSMSWDGTVDAMLEKITTALAAASAREGAEARHQLGSRTVWKGAPSKAYDYLVVGAGFAGSVLAERLASQLRKRVLVIDRRPHIAGNAFDCHDAAGVLMHKYGPHIFHTNSDEIVAYLSKFTSWRPYEHRVRAVVDNQLVPIPINRTTLNKLYGLSLSTDDEAAAFLAQRAEPVAKVVTSEDVVVSAVGRDLYEKFFRGYTRKQWALDPSELDKSVTARVPTRTSTDDRYFQDKHQQMPAAGYTRMFENMLDDRRITVGLGVDFEDVRDDAAYDNLVYTGPIDAFFNYRFGALPYRSLSFKHVTLDKEWHQDVGTVNYPDEATPYTRISEYKHLTGQKHRRTTITYEYPSAEGDPYYPIPRPENQALYKRYEALALATPQVAFCGRLATYRYYNMDQVVGQALATFRRIADRERGVDRGLVTAPSLSATTLPVRG